MKHAMTVAVGVLSAIAPCVAEAQRPEPPFFQSLAWSPDGGALVASGVMESWDVGYALYVLSPGGAPARRLDTGGGEAPLYPVYTPDGRRVAFGMRLDGTYSIWTIGADGAGLRKLLDAVRAGGPSYSPDGSRLAFQAQADSLRQVFVAGADGSGVRRVTSAPGNNWNPQWSPSGEWIAYYSDRRGGGAHDTIYVARPDGTDERKVTGGVFPTWAPDGRLVFSDRDGDGASLFIVNPDGSGRRRLVERAVYGAMSPDGLWIAAVAFDRVADGGNRYRIDVMRVDGTERRTIVP